MNRKGKGINAEREIIHLMWRNGWACVRVAGSGASRYPTPDIVTGKNGRVLAIECKAGKGPYQYLEKDSVENLKKFSTIFGAEAWIGVRFNNKEWNFFRPEDMEQTKSNYVITINSVGKNFEELINQTSKASSP
jgi:Holliday junction resolvase